MSIVADYARLIRLPGLGGLSIAPVFGAISVFSPEVIVNFKDIALLFLIGSFSAIYGFVLNDYFDVKIDTLSKELSERPLVKGTISRKIALLICLFCFICAFIVIFLFFYNNHPSFYVGILCILLSAVVGSIYNIYGKKFIGSDFLVALSEALLVLFGAFMVVQAGSLTVFSWIICILTFNQLVYMNAVEGGIKDADHDYKKNVKNLALYSGVKVTKQKLLYIPPTFKFLGISIRLFSSILIFVPFLLYQESYHYEWWNLLLLLLLAIFVLYGSYKFLHISQFDRKTIRKSIAKQTFLRYAFVPIMLIPLIDMIPAIILVLFPIVWYLVFTPLVGGKLLQPGI